MIAEVIDRWCEARRPRTVPLTRRAYMITQHLGGARCWIRGKEVLSGPLPLALLWSLALEIDERESTVDGEVCRACGGRGKVWRWGRRRVGGPVPDRTGIPYNEDAPGFEYNVPSDSSPVFGLDAELWSSAQPCACDGPKRPHRVFLHRLVADLADVMRRGTIGKIPIRDFDRACLDPICKQINNGWSCDVGYTIEGWPEDWLVALDKRAAEGLDWIGRWWLALLEWTVAGKLPDADALAEDLAALLPELEARERAKRLQAKCPTCADAKAAACCSCGVHLEASEITLEPDPYMDEINGDSSLHLQCESCREESAQDI